MRKKTKSIVISVLSLISAGCFLVGCGQTVAENKGHINNDKYEWGYSPVVTDICDADMKIDGVLDEARWKDKAYLIHEEDGVTMEYTTTFSQKGLYIAAIVHDDDIQWYVKKSYEGNSSFWFSIKGPDVTYKYNTQEFTLFIDPVCSNMVQMTKFQAAAKTNKPFEKHPDVMTAEAFLSWDTLNIELGENGELPEYVLINPHYRHIVETGSSDNAWLRPTLFFDDNDRQQQSGKFGTDGYLNPDSDYAIIGNAGNGMSKSDGWDVSQESEGIVRSVNDHSQVIFFKDIYSDAYVFETTLQVVKGLGYMYDTTTHMPTTKKPPSGIGIVNMVDEISLNAFLVNGNDLYSKAARPRFETLSFYVNGRGGWRSTQLGTAVASNAGESKITITCIKNGGNFYYIIDGVLVHTEYVSYLNGPSCPGFFAIDAEVIYSDYTLQDFSDNPAALAEVLEEYGCYMVSVNTDTEGGRLQASSGAANKGDDVNITISPDSGYLMTGFTINGEDCFDDVMNGMDKGVYTINNVQESMDIDATFTRITNDLLVYVKGDVKSTENVVVGNAIISVDDANGRYHIESGVSATGVFRIGLPMTGTFELGGKEFTFDGNYTIAAAAAGYHGLGKTIKIEENSENISGFDFRLTKVDSGEMRTTTLANGDVLYHPDSGWQTHSVYYVNEDNKATSAVFSVEVTTENGINFAEWGWTGVGIVVSNGNQIEGDHYYDYGGNKRTMPSNRYHRALFGFETTTSLMIYSGFNMNQNNNINRSLKIPTAENPTMEMTLLLNNDTFYWFIEDQYISAWSVTDPLFTPLKPENNDTENAKFSAGDSFMFGVGAYNLSALSPVSLRVTQELYGDDALKEMEDNQLYRDIFYPSKINVKEKANGEFVMPTGWMSYGYAMTMTESTDAAVYSIKVKCPEGLATSDAFYGNVGVKISNGSQFESANWYTYYDQVDYKNPRGSGCINWYSGSIIGFSQNLNNHTNGFALTSGALSNVSHKNKNIWPRIGDRLDDEIVEETMTVVFYQHKLYVFLGDRFISQVSLDDPAFTWKNGNRETKQFNENDQLIFGVAAVNISDSTPVTVSVIEEIYGENAINEIENNELYQFGIHYDEWRDADPILSRDAIANADGTYTLSWYSTALGGMAFQYFEGQSTSAVFSVDISMPTSQIYQTHLAPRVGITMSNGKKLLGSYNSNQVTPGEYQSTQIAFFKENTQGQTLCSGIDGFKNKGRDCASVPGYKIQTGGFSLTKETANLTVVLYNQKFYAFVDGAFVYSWAVTDPLMSTTYVNNAGVQASTAYAATDAFMFGICANGTEDWKPVFKVVKHLLGEEAIAEINTNALYKYQIVTPLSANVIKNADGSITHTHDWFKYSYAYSSTKFSDTVVYKTQITANDTDFISCNDGWEGRVGISFTNGDMVGSDKILTRQGNARSGGNASWLSGGWVCLSVPGTAGAANYKFVTFGAGIDSNWKNTALNTSDAMTSVTMTAVLYKGTIYVYVNDVFVTSKSLDDACFDYTNDLGVTKSMSSSDKLIFGTNALLMKTAPTTKELQYLTDAEALAEITSNSIYSNIATTV